MSFENVQPVAGQVVPVVSISDPTADHKLVVNADGSINVAGSGGGGGAVTQGTTPWVVSASGNFDNNGIGSTGAAIPTKAEAVGGTDGTNLRALSVNSSGRLQVDVVSGGGSNASVGAAGAAIPTSDTLMGASDGTNLQPLQVDGSKNLKVVQQGTVTVSGTVTTTPPANASTNVAQVAGTTADTNSGVKSAGTLRVVLATDQPQLTNKLLVTPDSVALPANQSVNLNQIVGTALDVNSGTKSAGTQRVVLATDQPQLTNALKVDGSAVTQPVSGTVAVSGFAATIKSKYGTNNQALTWTLTSITNASFQQSTAVDNTSNLYLDVLVTVKVKSGAASNTATSVVNIYAAASTDGGTSYDGGASGTNGSYTADVSPPNITQIGALYIGANNAKTVQKTFSVASAFGGQLPDHWSLIAQNSTGATLDASVGSAWYQGILAQSA